MIKMSEKNNDLYQKRGKTVAKHRQAEIAPTRAKERTRSRMIWTVIVMLALLAGSALLVDHYAEKGERPEFEDYPAAGLPSSVPMLDTNALRPELMMPSIDTSDDVFSDAGSGFPKAPRDPEQLATATEAIRMAHQFMQEQEWERAEELGLQALGIWPAMNKAQRLLGAIYTQQGRFDQAIAMLEQALQTDPFNAETYSNLAAAEMQKSNFEKAEHYLEIALKMSPNDLVAQLNMGLLYLATGQYSYAAEFLRETVDRVPGRPNVRNNLAVALMRNGEYEESRANLNKLIEEYPATSHAYFNMAITYTLEGDFDRAIEWIKQGAQTCSPILFQHFLTDPDFSEILDHPEFQALAENIYGELHEFQNTPKNRRFK